jgi:hypothetical protein
MSSHLSPSRHGQRTTRLRWLAGGILLLSLLVHLTLLEWLKGELILPTFDEETDQVISIALQTSPPLARAPKASVRQPAIAKPAPASAEVSSESAAVASQAAPEGVAATPAVKEEASEQQVPPAAPTPQAPLFERVSLPPAAELGYAVTAFKDGRKIEGHGSISWQPGSAQYAISGEAGVLFFTVLSYKSTGSVDALGIAPELYVEKRFRKPETNTHFHRERKEISFSASTNAYPSKGGEQDRASVIWQLAALGRGDGAKFEPGLAFEIFIAGTRSAADWRVYVNGKESLDLAGVSTEVWHLSLMPVERSYEQQFELWLAPQKEWYPVRLRYADKGDGYLEMLLTKLDMRK